jgi:GR25 family glycosyltransferase involved in LPS biosynthesis
MKSFIIHLSKIPASLETATRLKNQLAEYGMESELFEGTYGNEAVKMMEAEGREVHPWGIKGPPAIPHSVNPNIGNHLNPGEQGCFYSHYRLWQKCVELNESIIIFEDDIILSRGFIPIEWDDVLIVALGHPKKTHRYRHFLDTPSGPAGAADYYQSSMPGCCGYAIRPHAAKKLLDIYTKTYLAADNAINCYHVKMQIHNYVMGIALTKDDGKVSLTRSKAWREK